MAGAGEQNRRIALTWLAVRRVTGTGRRAGSGSSSSGSVSLADGSERETGGVMSSASPSVFAGFPFPREVTALASAGTAPWAVLP